MLFSTLLFSYHAFPQNQFITPAPVFPQWPILQPCFRLCQAFLSVCA